MQQNIINISQEKFNELEPIINFLFVVCNDIEHEEMCNSLQPMRNFDSILHYIDAQGSKASYYFGRFHLHNIAVLKTSDMGSYDVNSVNNALNLSISLIMPRFIIMPGIAASLQGNIKIGDVVIAKKVLGYESEKIKENQIIGRYPQYRSPRIFNLFDGIFFPHFNEKVQHEITQIIATEKNPDALYSSMRKKLMIFPNYTKVR